MLITQLVYLQFSVSQRNKEWLVSGTCVRWEWGAGVLTVSSEKDEAIMGEDGSDGYIRVCNYLMPRNILKSLW